jgi:RimJ/RimL family protein N-acetyltransferase
MSAKVTLRPLSQSDWPDLKQFSLPEDQAGFSDLPAKTMLSGSARDGHVICETDLPVGFFAIDRDYGATQDFVSGDVIGLRMFLVDQKAQGRGIATAACRALSHYLGAAYPGICNCYLTVNCRNPGAKRAYEKGGFKDTGELYLDGGFGPQHIMQLPLAIHPAP